MPLPPATRPSLLFGPGALYNALLTPEGEIDLELMRAYLDA